MKHKFYYTFSSEEETPHEYKMPEFEYYVDESLQDISEYLYEQKYNIKYTSSWYLTPGAREYIESIEKSWLDNTLDVYKMYSNIDFLVWLSDKYEQEAYNVYISSNFDDEYFDYSSIFDTVNE